MRSTCLDSLLLIPVLLYWQLGGCPRRAGYENLLVNKGRRAVTVLGTARSSSPAMTSSMRLWLSYVGAKGGYVSRTTALRWYCLVT
jgi:hypothetical protein